MHEAVLGEMCMAGAGEEREIQASLSGGTYLIGDPAVGACVPGDEVLDQPLDPATILGAQVLLRQTHVPVRTGTQHGQEGHEVTHVVHGELCGRGGTSGGRREGGREGK